MNPNTVLSQAQAAMRRANALPGANTEKGRMQDLAEAARHYAELDDWIGRGGFLPAQWANHPDTPFMTITMPAVGTTARREGGCGIVRLDHASAPYGPFCTLDLGHQGEHDYPYSVEHDHVNGQCVAKKEEQ